MPIKDMSQIINDGVDIPRRTTIPNHSTRGALRKEVQENINASRENNRNASSMKQVVPPLHRGDFLDKWQDDRKQLEQVRKEKEELVKENKKLKKIMNTTYSNTWGQYVETTKKK